MKKVCVFSFLILLIINSMTLADQLSENGKAFLYQPGSYESQVRNQQISSRLQVENLYNQIIELETRKPRNWKKRVSSLKENLLKFHSKNESKLK